MGEVFKKVGAQGELTFVRINSFPKEIGKEVAPEKNGLLIVGHSETGHHHVLDGECATLTRIDVFTQFLNVKKVCEVKHQREFDTHKTIVLQKGMYRVNTGREFDPFAQKIRASQD